MIEFMRTAIKMKRNKKMASNNNFFNFLRLLLTPKSICREHYNGDIATSDIGLYRVGLAMAILVYAIIYNGIGLYDIYTIDINIGDIYTMASREYWFTYCFRSSRNTICFEIICI